MQGLKAEVEFKPLGFNVAVLKALESGQVDAVMAGMGIDG